MDAEVSRSLSAILLDEVYDFILCGAVILRMERLMDLFTAITGQEYLIVFYGTTWFMLKLAEWPRIKCLWNWCINNNL